MPRPRSYKPSPDSKIWTGVATGIALDTLLIVLIITIIRCTRA